MADYTVTVTPPTQYAVTTSIGGKPKTNFTATQAPGASNDSSEGYTVGSVWCDVTNDLAYICLDSTIDAAVWSGITASGTVLESDYDAQTVLIAVADNTPLAVTIGASSFVGRKSTGDAGVMTAAEAWTEIGPDVVSQAEAEAGVATTERIWTAERVAQAIAALSAGGGVTETTERITFKRGLNDTQIVWVRIPDGHEFDRLEIEHRDASGTPAVPTAGTLAMSKETAGSNQFTAATIDLTSLTSPNSVLVVTTAANAGDGTLLHATAGNRQYVLGDRLKVTVTGLECNTGAELYLSIVSTPV